LEYIGFRVCDRNKDCDVNPGIDAFLINVFKKK